MVVGTYPLAAPSFGACNLAVGSVLGSIPADVPRVASLYEARAALADHMERSKGHLDRTFVVCLGGGVHDLSAGTLTFGREHGVVSGSGSVVWRGEEGATVVGGVQLKEWTPGMLNGGAVFTATINSSVTIDVIRQLWVSGARASRVKLSAGDSRYPAMQLWTSGATVGFTGAFPLSWGDHAALSAVEFTWPRAITGFTEPRCTVANITADRSRITLASPCGHLVDTRKAGHGITPPVHIEAAPPGEEFALAPGEFYHNRSAGTIVYSPRPGENLSTLQANSWIPVQTVLLRYNDSAWHTWDGVSFMYSTWLQPNTPEGFVDTQSAVFRTSSGTGEPVAAVQVWNASSLAFVRCAFSHLGGGYAVSAEGGSRWIEIINNTFADLSGGAVKLGNVGETTAARHANATLWDAHHTVTGNVVTGVGVEYLGAAAVFAGYIAFTKISHNTIAHVPYTGISVGWGWGYTSYPGYTSNEVSYNRIMNVMTKLKDGGGIYVNGATNVAHGWSTMQNNFVYHDDNVYAAYYLDNGASYWHVWYNVASSSPHAWAFFMTGGTGNPLDAAHHNVVNDFWYKGVLEPRNNCQHYECTKYAVHHVTGAWGAKAQAIIDASGAP